MAEIKFNQAYDDMGLLDQKFYDSTFKNTYDPNKSQPMLEGKSGYNQMKAAYEAQQEVPEKSFFGSLFSEASAAEPEQYGLVNTEVASMYTPEMQLAMFGHPNALGTQQYYEGTTVPVATPFSNAANTDFMSQFQTPQAANRYSGMGQTGPNKSDMIGNTIAEAMIDEDRIPGRNQKEVPNYQSGWDKFTGKIGDVWSGAKDKLSNFEMPPIGIMGLLQGLNRNPFDIDSRNYSKGLGLQVDDLRKVGFLPQKTADGYKILGGPLAGKNLVSAFGTNDYDEMLAKKFAWFQKRKDLGKGFSQKNWDKVKKEQEARAAEMRAHGQRGVGERTLGGNFQIERGGSDAVNRDLARREAANRNRSRAARQDTTSMRSAGRSYTDAQGNRGYSRGRKDGGRIGYANGGLASLFTRRG